MAKKADRAEAKGCLKGHSPRYVAILSTAGGHYVRCTRCGWAGPIESSPIKAIVAWNTRPDPGPLRETLLDPENLARTLHKAYRKLAPSCGYERKGVSWEDLPEKHRALMVGACKEMARVLLEGEGA